MTIPLEIRYTNICGEEMIMKFDEKNHPIFHHDDIHNDEEYEDIRRCSQYVFNADERQVLSAFMTLATELIKTRPVIFTT
jgi:hypothetical protein